MVQIFNDIFYYRRDEEGDASCRNKHTHPLPFMFWFVCCSFVPFFQIHTISSWQLLDCGITTHSNDGVTAWWRLKSVSLSSLNGGPISKIVTSSSWAVQSVRLSQVAAGRYLWQSYWLDRPAATCDNLTDWTAQLLLVTILLIGVFISTRCVSFGSNFTNGRTTPFGFARTFQSHVCISIIIENRSIKNKN
jgi:hypothetical protein